jgi:hypothetical protein
MTANSVVFLGFGDVVEYVDVDVVDRLANTLFVTCVTRMQ